MNTYQETILKLGQVEFEEIQDSDILIFNDHVEGKSAFYLYRQDGSLKDIQIGKRIPKNENKQRRPKQVFVENLTKQKLPDDVDNEPKEVQTPKPDEEKLIVVHEPVIKRYNEFGSIALQKRKKQKRNLSPEERLRRAEHMRKVAQEYWANKKKNDSRSEPNSTVDVCN